MVLQVGQVVWVEAELPILGAVEVVRRVLVRAAVVVLALLLLEHQPHLHQQQAPQP
jgi:hypothetical protein